MYLDWVTAPSFTYVLQSLPWTNTSLQTIMLKPDYLPYQTVKLFSDIKSLTFTYYSHSGILARNIYSISTKNMIRNETKMHCSLLVFLCSSVRLLFLSITFPQISALLCPIDKMFRAKAYLQYLYSTHQYSMSLTTPLLKFSF